MITQRKIVEYLFFSIISGLGTVGVGYAKDIAQGLIDVNLKLALMSQEAAYDRAARQELEKRVSRVETHIKK